MKDYIMIGICSKCGRVLKDRDVSQKEIEKTCNNCDTPVRLFRERCIRYRSQAPSKRLGFRK